MKSKEDVVLELFFNNPSREWQFEEILRETKIARSKTGDWLKKLAKERVIRKIKEKGRMPHYISDFSSAEYKSKKRLFSQKKLYESGLLSHLLSLEKAKTVILFGSFARTDWYKNSDIDLFIYGDSEGLSIASYELKLHRDIQVFLCKDKNELSSLGENLIKNIIKGNVIKGDIDFVRVKVNA